MSLQPPNKISQDNHIPEMLDQMLGSAEHGDFKEAFECTLIILSHVMWRIQELEK